MAFLSSQAWPLACLLLLLLLLSCFSNAGAQDVCVGKVLRIKASVSPAGKSWKHFGFLASFGWNGTGPAPSTQPSQLLLAEPRNACGPLVPPSGSSYAGKLLLVIRGNCSFVDKARSVQAAGATAMLLYNDQPGCIGMGYVANASGTAPRVDDITLAALSVTRKVGLALAADLEASQTVSIAYGRWKPSKWDPSAICMWAMAVATLVGGSLWSRHDHLRSKAPRGSEGGGGGGGGGQAAGPGEVVDLTTTAAVLFVVVASAMLLLLFFFLNQAFFYVILSLFCLGGSTSLTNLMAACVYKLAPGTLGRTLHVRWLGDVSTAYAACLPAAITLAIIWAVYRKTGWSWLLQDLLGISLMLLIMRTLRLPSLKVACVLLPCVFLYDVFWVFIQPLLVGNGTSVMVAVASGGKTNEFIPMLLRFPRLANRELGGYTMLGFGDIILPGLLVAYCCRLDADLHLRGLRGYFWPVVAAYGTGLVLTYVALVFSWFGDQGQPALLYLAPCTLGTTLALAWARGQAKLLFVSSAEWGGRGGGHDSDPEAAPPPCSAGAGSATAADLPPESMERLALIGHGATGSHSNSRDDAVVALSPQQGSLRQADDTASVSGGTIRPRSSNSAGGSLRI